MTSISCGNFMDFAPGDLLGIPCTPRDLPRIMTVPGIISDAGGYGTMDDDVSSSTPRERKILVSNTLPLQSCRDTETGKWHFSWDEDALLLNLKDGFSPETEVIYVGSLKCEVETSEQDEISQILYDNFKCVPTFLPRDIHRKFYNGFCKQHLWPLFHYMLPMYPDHGDRFDRTLWQAYVSANKRFADKVMEVINPEVDFVWVHDYHLMVMPTFLRKRFHKVKLGFFLHSPFPSSEIYRTLPVRDEVLKGLLNCDLIGFHTFDYARHFLSCCSRMLGLDYESKRGYIGLDYFGRTVYIKILPIGIHMGRLESVLKLASTENKVREIFERFKGKRVILGVDDMDIFKGISLKLLAIELLMQQNNELHGKLVLVQIVNPARSSGKDVQEAQNETYSTAKRINATYGSLDYTPVILIDRPVARYEKSAYYALAECCIVSAVRDGMNLVPYKYIVCRQGTPKIKDIMGVKPECSSTSMLVVSEFIGCSPSLSGAIRVNPWDIDAVADAVNVALNLPESEKQLRHEKHFRYVSSHDIAYWARSFMHDLERACQNHYNKRCWGIGLGLGFRVVSLSPSFRKLSTTHIVSAYRRSTRRAIFLDYDGTLVPHASVIKSPHPDILTMLNTISSDPRNTAFIVSGRGRSSLNEWLAPCKMLGIAAEHGYFIRWNKTSEWETSVPALDVDWKAIVEPIMESYTEATDGSSIEPKESALVWHHQDADPDFGACQAKELLNHLENVLANEPAVVKRGQQIVEVNPQGVSKGLAAEKVLLEMINSGKPPDFVMCIGDDRSDEDMFESILDTLSNSSLSKAPEIFACTVGQKPSKAKYYLEDTSDVENLLQGLAKTSDPKPMPLASTQSSFESIRDASSAPSTKSPARILSGVFSNAGSVFLKWLWSLKTANTKTVPVHRPSIKFENGYSVETVFDGSKLGIEPYSVEVLQSGELLILDSENSNIYRISNPPSPYSRPKLVAGSREGSSGHVDGRPREAKLSHPKGMAVDDKGNIYVADTDNMAIRKISDSGVTTIVGGKSGRGGGHVDGPGEDAKLSNDFDVVYVGSSCSLLVVDRGNKGIREIQLHFDDCADLYGSGFPLAIGVVLAAGLVGYTLALLQQRARSNAYSNGVMMTSEKHHENLSSHLGSIFASAEEIVSRFIPGFAKTPSSKIQFNDLQSYQQQQHNSYSDSWPAQQDSFEFPEDEPPPPPVATDTRAPTPKKTYAFMSKDSEKMNQIRQSRVFYNSWNDAEQVRPQLRIQQASFDSHSSHHHPSSDKKAGKEQDRDRPRRRKTVPKSEDHKVAGQDLGNVAPRVDFSRYEH